MTDINAPVAFRTQPPAEGHASQDRGVPCEREKERLLAYVELLFFAYRDFTAGPDAVLAEFNFGRAHHRVLHFVNRRPGLRVADLLDILKITKQSLARVLKQLVDEGYILQQAGEADRRERLLYATAKGSALAEKLASFQVARIAAALAEAGPGGERAALRFLAGMISPSERARVEALVASIALCGPAGAEHGR
jgi:DNA-binding MarR family transcriptional regulator